MQDHRHLTSEDVLRFAGVGLTLATLKLVIRELLGDCTVCRETLEQVERSHPGLAHISGPIPDTPLPVPEGRSSF